MKTVTKNDYIRRINKVVEYINNHLDDRLDLRKLASVANLSDYHFHRIFKGIIGEPPIAFIARLRRETAAQLLRYSPLSVEDIAFNIGYESASSLSKAFRDQYNITPTEYRTNKDIYIMKKVETASGITLKEPKIVELEPQSIIYVALTGEYGSLDYNDAYARLWACVKEQKLFTKGIETICLSYDDPKITESYRQRTDVCLVVHKPARPDGEVCCKELQGGRYAVFFYQGAYSNLSSVYDAIFGKWLTANPYELRNVPVFEKYLNNSRKTAPEKLKTEIYLPIK